jgi:hypothetical protein
MGPLREQQFPEVGPTQLSRQRSDNLLTEGCSFVPEDFPQDSAPDPPIERREPELPKASQIEIPLFTNL